ncbi:DUF502 domain-containing protein [Halobaculum lipolyticum]|uniref:DUF502 domain-containing protein n=1 Tax=Halobaculum lipolyticum TaxID=3032001 RepID=UPI0024C460A5|nr:DUF502 domain-containing protein [Halobaculum sp. DT31]
MSRWSAREMGDSVVGGMRAAFVTGVAVVVPLLVSLIVLAVAGQYVYQYLDLFSSLVLNLGPEARLTVATPVGPLRVGKETLIELLTPVVLVSVIVVMGLFINTTRFGAVAVDYFDAAVALVPGIGSVYESFRQMSDVMLEEDTQNFREVKLVEFPHEGAYTLGFLTTETPDPLREPTGHDRMLTLFLPLAPNPVMGGHLVHMPADRVMDVDMTVEEGIRAVVTSGVAVSGGDSLAGDDGLTEEQLRTLGGIEHADQQLNPDADSPDVRRSEDVDVDRDEEWDRQVDPERSGTPTDIARRTRAQRDDPAAAEETESRQPYSLYGGEEATTTPAREAGRYAAETDDTEARPARQADRPAEQRSAAGVPAAEADRAREHRRAEETRPEAAGDRPAAERADTDGRPATVTDRSDLASDDGAPGNGETAGKWRDTTRDGGRGFGPHSGEQDDVDREDDAERDDTAERDDA